MTTPNLEQIIAEAINAAALIAAAHILDGGVS